MIYLKKINLENLKKFLYLSRVELLQIYNRQLINHDEEICISNYYYTFLYLYEILSNEQLSNQNINYKDRHYLLHNVYADMLRCIEEIKWELRLKKWPISV